MQLNSNNLSFHHGKRGALLLAFMVFVALVGLGSLFIIPPVEKEGRTMLERNYETSIKGYYRALHDYFQVESFDAMTTVETLLSDLETDPAGFTDSTDEVLIIRQSEALLQDMMNKGYVTDRMYDLENTGFPNITKNAVNPDDRMTWEVLLIPLY